MEPISSQPTVRVYLLSYRRPHTLLRALQSLLAQTHPRWVCELHNDDPADTYPDELVARTNDPRIIYVKHAETLGPVGTFNLVFKQIGEPFMALLEDDNWWEPMFLETALRVMRDHPSLNLVWANMWKWQESPGNSWAKTEPIWPLSEEEIWMISEDHPRQTVNHLHSNGAMLLRISANTTFAVPASTPFVIIEPVRERVYALPMALITKPLGNFALTLTHCHNPDMEPYLQGLVLLAQSFLRHAKKSAAFYQQAWQIAKSTSLYLMLAIGISVLKERRLGLLFRFPYKDLAFCTAWCVRHPHRFHKMLRAGRDNPELSDFLERASQRKFCTLNSRSPRGTNRTLL